MTKQTGYFWTKRLGLNIFISDGLSQAERLAKLNAIAIQQMRVLTEDHRILRLEENPSEN